MTRKGFKNSKQTVLRVWILSLVFHLINGLPDITTPIPNLSDVADTTSVPINPANSHGNCGSQDCRGKGGVLWDLLNELKNYVGICENKLNAIEVRELPEEQNRTGTNFLEIARQKGLLDHLTIEIYKCENGFGKVHQCSGLRINETGCTLEHPEKSSRKIYMKLTLFNECVTKMHEVLDFCSMKERGKVKIPKGSPNFSEEQFFRNELNERYRKTCVFGSKYDQMPPFISGTQQRLKPKMLQFDTQRFNRSVFEHQGFRYQDGGVLLHKRYPALMMNCTKKQYEYNATSDIVDVILSDLPNIKPRGSKFICFASFFWYNHRKNNSESDEIEVTCMARQDSCEMCQNGAECKRFPVSNSASKVFCVCKHPYIGPRCEEIKTGLDLNCTSNQIWSHCGHYGHPNEMNPLCQPTCDQPAENCNHECPAAGGCACKPGLVLDGDTCVPMRFCPTKPNKESGKEKLEDANALGKVIISLASIAAVMIAAVLTWVVCICKKKIKDLAHNVKTIPPSLAQSMGKDPSCYDNHYYASDNDSSKDYITHEIHDILRASDDMDAASQKTEEETLRGEEEDPCIFLYPPPTPLMRGTSKISNHKELMYISIQPLKSSADSGIDVQFDDSRTRCSSGDLSISSPTFLYSDNSGVNTGSVGAVARMQSSSCDSGISSLRSTSVDETLSFSDDPVVMAKVPAVNTISGGGHYWSKDTVKPLCSPPVVSYFNKAEANAMCQSNGYFGKAQVNAVSGNYWNKLKVGNYWSKG